MDIVIKLMVKHIKEVYRENKLWTKISRVNKL